MSTPFVSINGCDVVSFHENVRDATTVALAWDAHKNEFIVWDVDPTGEASNGLYSRDLNEALLNYSKRVVAAIYAQHEKRGPDVVFFS